MGFNLLVNVCNFGVFFRCLKGMGGIEIRFDLTSATLTFDFKPKPILYVLKDVALRIHTKCCRNMGIKRV